MPRKLIDLTGQVFDRLTVISLSHEKQEKTQKHYYWNCICECGGSKVVRGIYLTRGATSSCGCRRGEDKRLDITGNRYGRLVALQYSYSKKGATFWECQCECGAISIHRLKDLQQGSTTSCGCYQIETTIERSRKHGHKSKFEQGTIYGSTTYNTWRGMIKRCTLPTDPAYKWYGGRGITVCDRWLESFENFLEDLGEKPKGYSIERKNVNGNYEKSNCCYIPKLEQAYNKTDTFWFTFRGETKCFAVWMNILIEEGVLEILPSTVYQRLKKGWSANDALFTPPLR